MEYNKGGRGGGSDDCAVGGWGGDRQLMIKVSCDGVVTSDWGEYSHRQFGHDGQLLTTHVSCLRCIQCRKLDQMGIQCQVLDMTYDFLL